MTVNNDTAELIQAFQAGTITRRSLLAGASALGVSASAVATILQNGSTAAQDPTATIPPTNTPIVEAHGADDAQVKITYWTILSGPDGDEMNAMVGEFVAENPDIAVESLQGLTDFIPKMQAAAISGTAPDVALIRQTYIAPFASRNILSALTPEELAAGGINAEDYDPTVWEFSHYQDQQYTIPLDIHSFALMYNRVLLEGAGATVPTTLEELLAVAQAGTKGEDLGYMSWILNNNDPTNFTWLWFNYQMQFGGQFLSEDGASAAFNTPEGVATLEFMKSVEDAGNPQHLPYFDLNRNGQVTTWPDGPWIITAMFNPEQAPAAGDLDVAVMPQHDPSAPAVWAQSHQLALPTQSNSDDARREASLKFVDWLTANAIQWAAAGQVPARNSAREEALASDDPYLSKLQSWADELPYAKFMPQSPALLEVLPRLGTHVVGAILGQTSIEDALANAESEVNDILSA